MANSKMCNAFSVYVCGKTVSTGCNTWKAKRENTFIDAFGKTFERFSV